MKFIFNKFYINLIIINLYGILILRIMFMSIRYKINYCYFFNCTYRNYNNKYNINNKIKNIWKILYNN